MVAMIVEGTEVAVSVLVPMALVNIVLQRTCRITTDSKTDDEGKHPTATPASNTRAQHCLQKLEACKN